MEETQAITIETIGHKINAYVGMIGALMSFISFCVLLGIWFGPVKDLPTQFNTILSQLTEIKSRQDKLDGRMDVFQIKYETMNGQVVAAVTEQGKIREDARRLEVALAQLTSTSFLKTEFLEWKAEFERRLNISTPQLNK